MDNYRELESQTEKGNLFTHSVLTEQIIRQNESDSFLYGLIDYLKEKGIVIPEELEKKVIAIKEEVIAKKESATLGVALRVDHSDDDSRFTPVNCSERMHICHAVCCKLSFALSVKEIEEGKIKWNFGKPYIIRHGTDGFCCHRNADNGSCTVYDSRPSVCRKYSCANDSRIWSDFENMKLNHEWIDANLTEEKLHLKEMYVQE